MYLFWHVAIYVILGWRIHFFIWNDECRHACWFNFIICFSWHYKCSWHLTRILWHLFECWKTWLSLLHTWQLCAIKASLYFHFPFYSPWTHYQDTKPVLYFSMLHSKRNSKTMPIIQYGLTWTDIGNSIFHILS
jgi:hypothetical protein